ncbi:MAG: tetratricopeptide repeat protein [Alphaproteobacteria bacterium]|nr:tetratricopeptide repeat protein [Alphaproteobacteria bacterium]
MKRILFVFCACALFPYAAWAGLADAVRSFNMGRYAAARDEFTYLASEGDSTAALYLGRMYLEGLGVPKNMDRGLRYWMAADKLYDSAASYQLGRFYLTAPDVRYKSASKGLEYLKKAAHAGNVEALYMLGDAYLDGTEVEKNLNYAFGFYLMAALKGEKKAQYQIGRLYYAGRGVPQDYESALKWLGRSANQGYVLAQQELANIRLNNKKIVNPLDAYAWFSILAAYNSDEVGTQAAGMRDMILAKLSPNKELLEKQRQVREWRPVAPEDSVPPAEVSATSIPVIPGFNDAVTMQRAVEDGRLLLTDGATYGVTNEIIQRALASKSTADLEMLINKAAEGGYKTAYAYYGDLLASRFGRTAEAAAWYQKGAAAGDVYAQYQLARAYCEGQGVDAGVAHCYGWLLVADKTAPPQLKMPIQNAIATVVSLATPEEKDAGLAFAQSYQTQDAAAAATAPAPKKTVSFF